MRIEGRKGKQHTGKTVRKENYKNAQALGKRTYEKIQKLGAKTALKNKNYHHKIGGAKEKYIQDDIKAALHDDIDEQLVEAEDEMREVEEANDPNYRSEKMSKKEKDSLKFARRMLK